MNKRERSQPKNKKKIKKQATKHEENMQRRRRSDDTESASRFCWGVSKEISTNELKISCRGKKHNASESD